MGAAPADVAAAAKRLTRPAAVREFPFRGSFEARNLSPTTVRDRLSPLAAAVPRDGRVLGAKLLVARRRGWRRRTANRNQAAA